MPEPTSPPLFDPSAVHPVEKPSIDFRYFYQAIVQRLWMFLVILGVALLAGLGFYFRQPTLYASTAILQMEQFEQRLVNGNPVRAVNMLALDYTQTFSESMRNPTVYYRTVLAAGLDKDPGFAPPREDGKPHPEEELADLFEGKISIKLSQGTRLIEVTVLDGSPARAKELVDTFIDEFLKDLFAKQLNSASATETYLDAEAAKLKAKLEDSERKLQQYKEQNNAVSLEETQNITVQKLKDINEKVTSAKSERLRLESDLDALQKLRRDDYPNILQIGSVSRLEDVAAARTNLATAKTDFDAVRKRYQYKHWKYIEANGRVSRLQDALNETLSNAADILAKQYAASLTTEGKLTESLKDQEKQALELNRIAIPYNVLAREVDSDRKVYDGVIDRLREMRVTENAQKPPFRVIQTAMVSSLPAYPQFWVILVRALAIGLGICIALHWVLESIDTSFRSVDEIEEVLEIPSLAVIPRLPRDFRSAENPRPLVLRDHHDSLVAEGFRTLRTSISLLGPEETRKIILITSAIPSEGKSFCALNVAAAFALEGKRTLLIDADLRRPTLQAGLLSRDQNTLGLTEVLAGVTGFEKAIHAGPIDNLDLMPAGARAPNPSELLAGNALATLLGKLAADYDRVVVDSAPINAVSDTLLLARHVQRIGLVIRVNKTPKKAVMRACRLVRKAGGNIAGAVLNRASTHHSGGYYYYAYSYDQKSGANG